MIVLEVSSLFAFFYTFYFVCLSRLLTNKVDHEATRAVVNYGDSLVDRSQLSILWKSLFTRMEIWQRRRKRVIVKIKGCTFYGSQCSLLRKTVRLKAL